MFSIIYLINYIEKVFCYYRKNPWCKQLSTHFMKFCFEFNNPYSWWQWLISFRMKFSNGAEHFLEKSGIQKRFPSKIKIINNNIRKFKNLFLYPFLSSFINQGKNPSQFVLKINYTNANTNWRKVKNDEQIIIIQLELDHKISGD